MLGNGVGDACEGDFDGDGVPDSVDTCPRNAKLFKTDFTDYEPISLDPSGRQQVDPLWKVVDNVSICTLVHLSYLSSINFMEFIQ